MQRLILRWAINSVAIYVAVGTGWIEGIHTQSTTWWAILILGFIFGGVNTLLRPLLKFLTCPLILLTLGLFTFVINALLFALTGWIGQQFGVGWSFADPWFWNAFLGALVVGIVSMLLTILLRDELEPRKKKRK